MINLYKMPNHHITEKLPQLQAWTWKKRLYPVHRQYNPIVLWYPIILIWNHLIVLYLTHQVMGDWISTNLHQADNLRCLPHQVMQNIDPSRCVSCYHVGQLWSKRNCLTDGRLSRFREITHSLWRAMIAFNLIGVRRTIRSWDQRMWPHKMSEILRIRKVWGSHKSPKQVRLISQDHIILFLNQ